MPQRQLQNDFHPISYEDWLEKIEPLLKGKSFTEKLASTSDDDLVIQPLYSDTMTHHKRFHLSGLKSNSSWKSCDTVTSSDPIGQLAQNGFLIQPLEQVLETLHQSGQLHMRADGRVYHEAGASEAQEIACIAATTVTYLKAIQERSSNELLGKMRFALSADQDFFLTIAKHRALRFVLHRIATAIATVNNITREPQNFHLVSETSRRMMTIRDPHTNLLRVTIACAAALLGGADEIITRPFNLHTKEHDVFADRLARNTQLILREESFLGHIMDPTAGSWAFEKLTTDLAQKSWSLFQQIETEGGMIEALKSGFIQTMIHHMNKRRIEQIRQGKKHIIGVTAFPLDDDRDQTYDSAPIAEVPSHTALRVEPLHPILFEELATSAGRGSPTPPETFIKNMNLKDIAPNSLGMNNAGRVGDPRPASKEGTKS